MSRVLTFSRTFPSYHPRAGEPTYFVEKFLNSQSQLYFYYDWVDWEYKKTAIPKYHTIRAGSRWKVGDKFSPRVWSGKPYRSPQIIIAPDIEIKKVWKFGINIFGAICIDGVYLDRTRLRYYHFGVAGITDDPDINKMEELSKNDGLSPDDLKAWFKYPKHFEGQIISWSDHINY